MDTKVAVITGAASGIGRATALRFAGEGASVVIADLNRNGGEAAVRGCRENAGKAAFQLTDVSSGLDVIYNNAGLGDTVGPLEKKVEGDFDESAIDGYSL